MEPSSNWLRSSGVVRKSWRHADSLAGSRQVAPRNSNRGVSTSSKQNSYKDLPMRSLQIAAISIIAFLVGPASAQTTKEKEPSLSDDARKPQQNSADESAVRGRLEDGIKPGKPSDQTEANKKVEDAAVEAKRKSDEK